MKRLTIHLLAIPLLLAPLHSTAWCQGFVRAEGRSLVLADSGETVALRGMNLVQALFVVINGNQWVLDDPFDQGVPEYDRLTPEMFSEIASLGMNSVRMNLNYRYFEDNANPGVYKPEGFELLDKAVSWARANGLLLSFAMTVPPGGFQPSGGGGAAQWDDPVMRRRLTDLWRAIAARYAAEPTVLGYDLLNEPNPTQSAAQWKVFSEELIAAIRSVDTNHLVIVEEVNSIFDAAGNPPNPGDGFPWQFIVSDTNVLYDFHFYAELSYTQQLVGNYPRFGPYPDPSVVFTDHDGQVIGVWDAAYLELLISGRLEFGVTNNVPLKIGEWGAGIPCFFDELGGLQYTEDLLGILLQNDVHFDYFTYDRVFFEEWKIQQNPAFGVLRQDLIALFQTALGGPLFTWMSADKDQLPLATGGTQAFALQGGSDLVGLPYWILGSVSGTSPGVRVGGIQIPLNLDPYLLLTATAPGSSPVLGGLGQLDSSGQASAGLVLPAGLPPGLAGLTVNHAFVVWDGSMTRLLAASNPVSVLLVP